MIFPQEQIDELKSIYPELAAASEGGVDFIRIDKLTLPTPCKPKSVVGLLCPTERDGYPSRLFISEKVDYPGKANWNPATGSVILGKQWWGLSWKTKPGQTLLQMVIDHLGGFKP